MNFVLGNYSVSLSFAFCLNKILLMITYLEESSEFFGRNVIYIVLCSEDSSFIEIISWNLRLL